MRRRRTQAQRTYHQADMHHWTYIARKQKAVPSPVWSHEVVRLEVFFVPQCVHGRGGLLVNGCRGCFSVHPTRTNVDLTVGGDSHGTVLDDAPRNDQRLQVEHHKRRIHVGAGEDAVRNQNVVVVLSETPCLVDTFCTSISVSRGCEAALERRVEGTLERELGHAKPPRALRMLVVADEVVVVVDKVLAVVHHPRGPLSLDVGHCNPRSPEQGPVVVIDVAVGVSELVTRIASVRRREPELSSVGNARPRQPSRHQRETFA